MKRNIFIILLSVVVVSCANFNSNKDASMDKEISYLALGDSYTIGQSVSESERFPVLLAEAYNKQGFQISKARIIAKTGWTTDELLTAILDSAITETYDMVSLLIGVNNQYRGRSVEEFREQFIKLLNMAVGFAGNDKSKVFVVSIPDWGVSPFAEGRDTAKIANEIDLYNKVKKEETEKRDICFVDITDLSRLAKNKANYFASDGLHFSGEMHALWVKEIVKSYEPK